MDSSKAENRESVVPHSVLSAASHELRGPLGVARGYLRLLVQGGELDARAAKAVQEATRATDRMADLLDELSVYARWARGDARLMRGPVPLHDVLTRAMAASHLPSSPAVTATLDVPADVNVDADRDQLSAACAHLISALARAQVGDTELTLRARKLDSHVELRISSAAGLDGAEEGAEPMLERSGARPGGGVGRSADPSARRHAARAASRIDLDRLRDPLLTPILSAFR